jgi:hypothetical protein
MATSQMLQTCVVERVSAVTYDTATLEATAGSRTTIYTGICRVWEQQNPSQVMLGESEFVLYQTVLSIPWDTPTGNIPALHDEFQILTSPTDPKWVGNRFRIQSSKRGGQIMATRSFVVEKMDPRP